MQVYVLYVSYLPYVHSPPSPRSLRTISETAAVSGRPYSVRMVPETQPGNSPQQLLQQWIGDLPYQLLLLEKVLLGRSTPFDYSPESLETLEARLLEHHDSVQEPKKRAEFVESAMAYLGEV